MSETTFPSAEREHLDAIVALLVQDKLRQTRERAIAFYEQLGFEASHVGFKLYLDVD